MPNDMFESDPIARTATRYLLGLQIAAMLVVLVLSFFDIFVLALVVSFLTFAIFVAILLWLYVRYQNLPVVREKRDVQRLVLRFRKNIQAEALRIQSASQERERLTQSKKDEIHTALSSLQRNYIEEGLTASSIREAVIPGVGSKLKERLAGHGILSAAQVSDQIAGLPGFGEAKCLALLSWRSTVQARLESTKPGSLPDEQLEAIQQKFRVLHDANDAVAHKALTSKQILEYELMSLVPRLRYLAPVTFRGYVSKSLASRGVGAAFVAFLLIVTQVVSSVSATGSAIIASIPTWTSTPTATATPTQTFTPRITDTPTMTSTPTIMNTPTQTFTATSSSTPQPTVTVRPPNTPTLAPSSGGGGTGNCHPSYPGVCIPPPPPDLNCKDVPYRRFPVIPPDPHNFDGDADGIGCES